jgi:hypothetical protein
MATYRLHWALNLVDKEVRCWINWGMAIRITTFDVATGNADAFGITRRDDLGSIKVCYQQGATSNQHISFLMDANTDTPYSGDAYQDAALTNDHAAVLVCQLGSCFQWISINGDETNAPKLMSHDQKMHYGVPFVLP